MTKRYLHDCRLEDFIRSLLNVDLLILPLLDRFSNCIAPDLDLCYNIVVKTPIDTRYAELRNHITNEAAQVYVDLDGTHNVDVIIWEAMEMASRQNRLLGRLLANPGFFIAALYNSYGPDEYEHWRDEALQKADILAVDRQG
jgi:hypothetical protein